MGSSINLIPNTKKHGYYSHIYETRIVCLKNISNWEMIGRDWKRVGGYFWEAMDEVSHVQEKRKEPTGRDSFVQEKR